MVKETDNGIVFESRWARFKNIYSNIRSGQRACPLFTRGELMQSERNGDRVTVKDRPRISKACTV